MQRAGQSIPPSPPTFTEKGAKIVNNRHILVEVWLLPPYFWFLPPHFSLASEGPKKYSRKFSNPPKQLNRLVFGKLNDTDI